MKISNMCIPLRPAYLHILRASATVMLGLCLTWVGTGGISLAQAGERPLKSNELKPELLYHNYCSVCHGDRGDGRSRATKSLVPPPRDFTTATNLARETMIEVVTNGKPGTAMTGWKSQLNEKEIASVVDYIRNGFMLAAIDPLVARGRSIYGHSCATCHGESGKGQLVADVRMGTPPPDLSALQANANFSRERLIISISRGKPGTAMEGFSPRLSDQDIEAVTEYLMKVIMTGPIASISGTRARGGQPQEMPDVNKSKASLANTNLPLPKGLTGNPQRGKKYYLANCSACHGAKGNGQGPRAYFINPKPRNFFDKSSAALNRPMLFAAISMGKTGTEMPAWSTVLKDQEIADIAEFVYRSFIQPNAIERTETK